MSKCAPTGCFKAGINRCSICLREPYCSGECQRGDWKPHKSICKILKKLSLQFQPYDKVIRVIAEITTKKKEEVRVLGHLISYAEYQFGDRVLGKAYRERGNGERIDYWKVKIMILIPIYLNLNSIFGDVNLFNIVAGDKLILPYCGKMLDFLKPWSSYLDVNCTSHIDSLNKNQIDHTIQLFSQIQCNIGAIHQHRNEFVLAKDHCQRALSYARMYEEKKR
jgi:hypothetical protein